jgi:WD40 repeat protein
VRQRTLRLVVAAALLPLLSGLLSSRAASERRLLDNSLPHLPNAVLLVGNDPFFLAITIAGEMWALQPEPSQPKTALYSAVYPSISRDGKLVAYGRLTNGNPRRIAISTYSLTEHKTTTYSEGELSGTIAVSPDALRIAYVVGTGTPADPAQIRILDLKSNREESGPSTTFYPSEPTVLTWSPNSRDLAYTSMTGDIQVWNGESKQVKKVAHGDLPSWSPDGLWIAYLAKTTHGWFDPYDQCLLVRSDGSSSRLLVPPSRTGIFGHRRYFSYPPVWSPDSKSVLLNEVASFDRWTMNTVLVDVETGRLAIKFKDTQPVVGWAAR